MLSAIHLSIGNFLIIEKCLEEGCILQELESCSKNILYINLRKLTFACKVVVIRFLVGRTTSQNSLHWQHSTTYIVEMYVGLGGNMLPVII